MSAELPSIASFKKADHKYKSPIQKDLQVAIETCIDVVKIIISEKSFVPPESIKDVCTVLCKNVYIDSCMLKSLEGLAGKRKILVHRYEKIDLKKNILNIEKAASGLSEIHKAFQKGR